MVTTLFVSSAGKILTLGGQHAVAACEQLEQDLLQKHLKPKPWMVRFTETRLRADTPLAVNEILAGHHNNIQHGGTSHTILQRSMLLVREFTRLPKSSPSEITDLMLAKAWHTAQVGTRV